MNSPEPFGNAASHHLNRPILAGELSMDSTTAVDSEVFIRRAFEANAEKGFDLLFRRYFHPLCSHAARFVYSIEVAEDLVTDIFGQFWQKQLHKAVTTSFRAYLFTSVRHAAFAHLRTELGRELPTDIIPESVSEINQLNPHQQLQYTELYLKIDALILSMPPQSQRVFVMSRFEGKKNALIAEELGISVKTVEGHITKVLAVLRQSLHNQGLLSMLLCLTFWAAEQGVNPLFSLLRMAFHNCL
ncbi:RNA polymerase sigma-70 factor [Spirosoma sp.]|uniref:RNA polymerase sigma-70 factor n=1 Tax=Spirosoma sp. TaxID=1899569 RepID=UPI0026121E5B|nr:RNA polymerase sigma-70 factor [Spirosoma sp.]MCX6213084.1 RNA polymerase sigma-70 factor [Spirosoma sp.]